MAWGAVRTCWGVQIGENHWSQSHIHTHTRTLLSTRTSHTHPGPQLGFGLFEGICGFMWNMCGQTVTGVDKMLSCFPPTEDRKGEIDGLTGALWDQLWGVLKLTEAVFSYELQTLSGESGPNIVRSCSFTHGKHNRRLSVADVLSPTGNINLSLYLSAHLKPCVYTIKCSRS